MTVGKKLTCVAGVLLSAAAATAQKADLPTYRDPRASVQARTTDLLKRMSLEEKVAQLSGGWNLPSMGGPSSSVFTQTGLDGALTKKMAGQGLGTYVFLDEFLGGAESASPKVGAERRNLLQAWVLKNTRLGIPVLFHGEALHGAVRQGATLFPAPIGLGSSWDLALIQKSFGVVAQESRAAGNALVLAPVLDLIRDPRYGRVQEMYSEDPYLVARLGMAAIKGLQGPSETLDDDHVFATAKHFIHGQPENGTNVGPSDFSERTMRSVFLYPFEQAVKEAHIEAIMPSYNETGGGIPSNANPWLLKDVLRQEWGFTGLTVSDYMAVQQLSQLHHVVPDVGAAGVLAFNSGVDMELPISARYPSLVEAARQGKVSETDLDASVGRVLSAKIRAGLFEKPYVDAARATAIVGSQDHVALARQAAEESIVLLKNENGILPLKKDRVRTIAVIGPNARAMRLGTYSGYPLHYTSIADGIQSRVGPAVKVLSAEGCRISEHDASPKQNAMAPYRAADSKQGEELLQQAVEAAKVADVVILALGDNEVVNRESLGEVGMGKPSLGDTDRLELPGAQAALVQAVAALGKPMVGVLLNGRPYSVGALLPRLGGLLEAWYPGQETGNAVADILFGDVNPSGRLAVTIPRSVGQLPVYYYKTPAARRGYVLDDNTPLFPFGFGLSYTTFTYGKPSIDRSQITSGGTAKVSVQITNSGLVPGTEVVQMYVHHPVSSVVLPVLLLRGFERVTLDPGATTTVTFQVGPAELQTLNARLQAGVEPGDVEIRVGRNAAETSPVVLTIRK